MVVEMPPSSCEAMRMVGGRRGRKASSCEEPESVGECTPAMERVSRLDSKRKETTHLQLIQCTASYDGRRYLWRSRWRIWRQRRRTRRRSGKQEVLKI